MDMDTKIIHPFVEILIEEYSEIIFLVFLQYEDIYLSNPNTNVYLQPNMMFAVNFDTYSSHYKAAIDYYVQSHYKTNNKSTNLLDYILNIESAIQELAFHSYHDYLKTSAQWWFDNPDDCKEAGFEYKDLSIVTDILKNFPRHNITWII